MPEEPRFENYGVHFSVVVREFDPETASDRGHFLDVLRNAIRLQDDDDRVRFVSLVDQIGITMESNPAISIQDHSGHSPARDVFMSRLQSCFSLMQSTGLDIQNHRWEADVFLPIEDLDFEIGSLIDRSATQHLLGDDLESWGATGFSLAAQSSLKTRLTLRLRHTIEDEQLGIRFASSERYDWSDADRSDFAKQGEAFGERIEQIVQGLRSSGEE